MPVHIDQMESEVVVEPQSTTPADAAQEELEWQMRQRIAAQIVRMERDRLRTRASAYDD